MRRRRIDEYTSLEGRGSEGGSLDEDLSVQLAEIRERMSRIEKRLDEVEGLLKAILRLLKSGSDRGVSRRGGSLEDRV